MKNPIQSLKFIGAAFCLSIIIAPPSLATTNAETQKSIKQGQQLAQKHCAKCHNIKKVGKSPIKLAPPFRTFASKWPLESLEEALAEGIVVGHSIMPEFELMPEEITAMLDFMADLAKK